MEDGPPPLPLARVPLVTLTGAVGLVFVAIAGAAVSWLATASDGLPGPVRLLVAIGAGIFAFLGIGFSLMAGKRTTVQKAIFVIALILGFGAVGLSIQTTWQPASEAYALAERGIKSSSRSENADAEPVASAPIPQVESALTRDAVEPFYRAWIEEKLGAGYDAHGLHDARWDRTARDFVTGTLAAALRLRSSPDAAQLEAWAAELTAVECNDPLVLTTLSTNQTDDKLREESLRKAAAGLEAQGYAPGLLFLTRLGMWSQLTSHRSSEADRWAAQAIAALKDEFATGKLSERDYWVWNYFFINGAGETLLETKGEQLLAAVDSLSTVEPWFKHRLRGQWEIKQAWEARSSKYANQVSSAGWAGFSKHLKAAREELTESWKLHPEHPAAAELMITVAMGESDHPVEEIRQWFDRAVTARFDYLPAYKSALWALRPRWHGSPEAMQGFGRACAATKRFDTSVPWEYFIANQDIASEWDEPHAFYLERAPYAELRQLCEAYANEPKAPETPVFYYSHLAMIAAAGKHREDTLSALQKIDFQIDPAVARAWRTNPVEWPFSYLARSGPIKDRVVEAERAAQRGAYSEAIAALGQAAATPELDPASKAYAEARIEALQKLVVMESVPWEPYLPPTGDQEEWTKAGWIGVRGKWSLPDAKTLELVSDKTGDTLVHSNIPPGTNYELRGEFEYVSPVVDRSAPAITMGWPEDHRDVWLSIRFQRKQGRGDGIIFAHAFGSDNFFPFHARTNRVKFLMKVAERHLTVTVDGEKALDTNFRPPGDVSGQPPVLGFGLPGTAQPVTVRFYNVEWRRFEPAK
jgi:hypothetical protein